MDDRKNNKAVVMFRGGIASYKGTASSQEVFFTPRRKSFVPKNDSCLVILPDTKTYPRFYHGKAVYSVKIINPFIMKGIKVYENIHIPGFLFKNLNGDKAVVIVMDPREKHRTFLLRIWSNKNKEEIIRFVKKNLMSEKIIIKDGIIEIISDKLENPEYLKKDFLEKLSEFISSIPET